MLLAGLIGVGTAHADTPDWTGFYLGAHIGNAASANAWKDVDTPATPADSFVGGGGIYGLHGGYNWQSGPWVLGIEADAALAGINGGAQCATAVYICDAEIDALGTLTGRLGIASGDFLFYGKLGAAWVHQKLTATPSPDASSPLTASARQFQGGWTIGAGLDYALTSRLSARVEYDYLHFGQNRVNLTNPIGDSAPMALDQNMHLVKLGLTHKFSGPPLRPRDAGFTDTPPLWNGFYIGLHTGGAWGTSDWKSATGKLAADSSFSFPGSGTADGMIAGGQIGFNRQFNALVLGGEIDASWADINGATKCGTGSNAGTSWNYVCHNRIDALGTVTGRIGWAEGKFLVYGKAGGTWANERYEAMSEFTGSTFKGDTLRWGYVLGAGLEYALTPAWSGKVEYNYLDFGTKPVSLVDQSGNASTVELGYRTSLFKMGLNYRLGVDPAASAAGRTAFGASPLASNWRAEIGTRYWVSNGNLQLDLYDPDLRQQLNSRLIYRDMVGHSVETFARFDHDNGLFVKGNFGLGSLVSGTLNDEDFPPDTDPYSNTSHDISESSLRYASLDVGTALLRGKTGSLGAYVGYRYFYQRGRGFGCTQIASNNGICGTQIASDYLGLSETEQWRGAAIGLNARFGLTERLSFEVDAAYLPYVSHATVDNHWFRPDINPAPAPGHGSGTQFEAILSYAVTDRLSVALGGRYWFFSTDRASTRFPGVDNTSPLVYLVDRYGGFVQTSYRFGGPDKHAVAMADATPVARWSGWYVGGHLGAGFGSSQWADPYPAGPTGDRVNVGGVIGGVHTGVNVQNGAVVTGAEIAGSLARLRGTETCFGGFQPASAAGLNCENTTDGLVMLTARVGYATGQNLFYVKAGGALARERHVLNSGTVAGGTQSSTTVTNAGWVAGAGIEHALVARWSVRAEYNYLDFGSRAVDFAVPAAFSAVASEPVHSRRHLLTVGVNYRFGE